MGLINKIFGDASAREVKKIEKQVEMIEALDEEMQALSDSDLRAKTDEFKTRLANGETLDDLLPEAFAVCREAAVRSLGMKHFHVQLIGGIVLHQGRISEMKTGEGKTLVATLPVYLNALEGKGVHVVTVNDYLAKRDAEWMGRLYNFLGMSVGVVIHGVEGAARKAAYQADITYGTNNEFGFDYLRDNMVTYRNQLVQRDLNYAIIDEVDSILIDEARTPLIISGRGEASSDLYERADKFVKTLKGEWKVQEEKDKLAAIMGEKPKESTADFVVEEKEKQISLTEHGIKKAEAYFGLENYGDPENIEINHHVQQALKANNLMTRDVDYIVKDGEILIVDEFTGRLMFGRRFNNGLHQAIEAKEHVAVNSESKTLATITLQNYFRMYGKLAGMTGTAKTEESEFRDIYNMDVVEIPTNLPIARVDLQDSVYRSEEAKVRAIVERIAEVHETGQPILVGTISIEKSEKLSSMLNKRGIKHNVLNAKQHALEAEIVADAGRKGQVTIATNMAGRGTDIILGGNPEFYARRELRKLEYTEEQILFAIGMAHSDDRELNAARAKYREIYEKEAALRSREHDEVVELGGLFIIGSERHESRRIDNQLRGRSGRQGDPGVTQFFISLEDDLMRLFGGERAQMALERLGKFGMQEDDAIEAGMLTRSIENAQKRVESKNFSIRKYVLQYDNVMNKQREIIYGERRKVLFGEDVSENIKDMRDTIVNAIIDPIVVASKFPEEWNFAEMNSNLRKITPLYRGKEDYTNEELLKLTEESLRESVIAEFDEIYQMKESEIGSSAFREIERAVLLRVVDSLWMDHIDAMDQLKSGIGLRSIGQMDPAAEYAKEGFEMFEELVAAIQEDTVKYCYGVTKSTTPGRRQVVSFGTACKEEYVDEDVELSRMGFKSSDQRGPGGRRSVQGIFPVGHGAPPKPPKESKEKPVTVKRAEPKVGRNDPCPCGSGKKYKNCCMKKDLGDPFSAS